MAKDLTQGSVLKNIALFSLPYLLSYFLQTLYGMADLFISGQFNGADVISAVAIGSQVMHMLTVMIVGLAMGTTVAISRAVGAKDEEKAKAAVGNTALLFLAVSAALTAVLLLLCPAIVAAMSTPAESVEHTRQYLTICFLGIPFITAYNIIASVFRGMGDSKTPMVFIAVCCFLNIALDYLFIGVFGMKASGAALGTVISQTVSVAISLWAIKKTKLVSLARADFKIKKDVMGEILKVGVPVACQDGFIQISFLLITVIANSRGVEISAAVGIVEKIISFLFLVPSSMLSAISAVAAQNLGVSKPERAKQTLFIGTAIAMSFGVVFAFVFQFAASSFVSLFTDDQNVVRFGAQYLKSYVFDCIFAGFHFSFSGYFCALGKSVISFFHNMVSIVLARVPDAYLASKLWPDTLYPMGWAAPLGSLISSVICLVFFIALEKKEKVKVPRLCACGPLFSAAVFPAPAFPESLVSFVKPCGADPFFYSPRAF